MKNLFEVVRPRKQLLGIFIGLFLLASIPNIGHLVDETICASKPCQRVDLQNPLLLPYSWILPEKKCTYCTLAESCYSILTQDSFPVIQLMNLGIAVSSIFIMAVFLDYGILHIRHHQSLKKRVRRRRK